ncbi:type III secretion system export apparatus subunit SctT [Rhizobium oryzicola]|uniref:Type III secretion system export apparatus subunit SctT n=1 Tax=Rhizobium oryzicola TaxID=1232668 RepID=A0ABT8SYY6_9HYPH|nr:type III secretion system export apparatus subunit SctT [Rhizobium oryzicola]MDO1583191.1 type III secretion system export apparatus subunit SctT [Rhizobium oryzicola]
MNEIIDIGRLYFSFFDREIIALILTLPRIYSFMQVSQLLADTAVPRISKTAAILSLSIIAVPINMADVAAFDRSVVSFVAYVLKEYAIGFVLGYIVSWIFWAVQSAGAFIDNQRGAAVAASIDPLQGHETSPLGILFSQAFLTYIYSTGAMLPILGLLYQSYHVWPATRGLPVLSPHFPELALSIADNALRIMVIIAGPIAAVMFLSEFALAMVSRFAPQVQVFILAMPIKSGLAIFLLIFYFARFMPYSVDQLQSFRPLIDRFYAVMQFSNPPPGMPAPPAYRAEGPDTIVPVANPILFPPKEPSNANHEPPPTAGESHPVDSLSPGGRR